MTDEPEAATSVVITARAPAALVSALDAWAGANGLNRGKAVLTLLQMSMGGAINPEVERLREEVGRLKVELADRPFVEAPPKVTKVVTAGPLQSTRPANPKEGDRWIGSDGTEWLRWKDDQTIHASIPDPVELDWPLVISGNGNAYMHDTGRCVGKRATGPHSVRPDYTKPITEQSRLKREKGAK